MVPTSNPAISSLAHATRLVVKGQVERLIATADEMLGHMVGEADPRPFDILYPAFGSTPRSELAKALGAVADASDCVPFHAFSDGLLPSIYAAGDVVEGLDQISVAMGQGAMAATRLHNWLRETDGHVMADQR